jgi:hypothetical protein
MLIMLGLFLLPAATFGAWHYERANREIEEPADDEASRQTPNSPSDSPSSASIAAQHVIEIAIPQPQTSPAAARPTAAAARSTRIDSAPPRRPVEPTRHRRAADISAGR